jgi:hypothetical protein
MSRKIRRKRYRKLKIEWDDTLDDMLKVDYIPVFRSK